MPKISIIVPVYNAGESLEDCLNSLVNQTFKDLEFIIVNDESTDNSRIILSKFEKKDNRFKIIQIKNSGVSIARNIGIDASDSEYIMFVDADDWIDKDTCEVALNEAINNDLDVVMWGYVKEYNGTSKNNELFTDDKKLFEKDDVRKKLHRRFIGIIEEELSSPENADALSTVWGKLYKSSIIKKNNIRFDDIRKIGSYEDGMFNLYLFYYANKALYLKKYFYHYRKISSNSISNSYRKDLFDKWEYLHSLMQEYIDINCLGDKYKEALNNRICLSIIGIGLIELNSNNSKNILQKVKTISGILNKDRQRIAYKNLKFKYLPISWRMFLLLAKYRCGLGVYITLLIIKKLRER